MPLYLDLSSSLPSQSPPLQKLFSSSCRPKQNTQEIQRQQRYDAISSAIIFATPRPIIPVTIAYPLHLHGLCHPFDLREGVIFVLYLYDGAKLENGGVGIEAPTVKWSLPLRPVTEIASILWSLISWEFCSMAVVTVGEASSSSSNSGCTYDVFLSFRGDTRKNFTDHLYTALETAPFRTFKDDYGIERGENIKSELEKAIQQSRSSVIVFSKGYASSKWCLDELVMILEHKKTSKHVVWPVFYDVDPSQVGNQSSGGFAEAFAEYEEQFKEETSERKNQWMDRVKGWRAALKQV